MTRTRSTDDALATLQAGYDDFLEIVASNQDALMELVRSGEAENGPLILSALWLAANRDRIRREAGP